MNHILMSIMTCAVLSAPALADIEHKRTDKSYRFDADDLSTAGDRMMSSSPVKQNGQRFAAFTWSTWNWSINWFDHGSNCELTSVEIEMETEMTLPVWRNVSFASSQAQEEWRRFSTALVGHENGHVEINEDTVEKLQDQLEAMPAAETCDALYEQAKEIAAAIEEDGKAAHLAYDRNTQHGKTQGAWLRSGNLTDN